MAEDDEFGDEIDWSAVHLPSVPASTSDRRAPPPHGNDANGLDAAPRERHSWGGGAPAAAHQYSGGPPWSGGAIGSTGAPPAGNLSSAGNDLDALRKQIESLQNQLLAKDDQIFELEATAATSTAESTHRTQKAESEARERIRLAEEESRRARAEAERYRGGYIRHKKRVAELEAGQRQPGDGGGNRPGHAPSNNLAAWGPPVADVELRKVTPVTEDDASPAKGGDHHMSPTEASGSKKRKARQSESTEVDIDMTKYLPQQLVGAGRPDATGGDSVRQRLARHLLEREEMGCYSMDVSGAESEPAAAMDVENGAQQQSASHPNAISKAMRHDLLVDGETQAFLKSILYQMAEAPDAIGPGMPASGNLSSSGLVWVLLLRFNALFHRVRNKDDADVDVDGDHVMGDDELKRGDNGNRPSTDKCYQRTALILWNSHPSDEGQRTLSTHNAVSWRAALRLLRILHDILLLSENAREDLRWWFYQSRQTVGDESVSGAGESPSNAGGPNAPHQTGLGSQGIAEDAAHPRIEGMPRDLPTRRSSNSDCREMLWTRGCHSNSQKCDIWDPVTMAGPCNTLFELLVGIMQGNIFDCSLDATKDDAPDFGSEEALIRFAQLKALDLVLALMSDAPPYDHAKDSNGNRTPYLWKFWFDSLLPSHPATDTTLKVGDILSSWEKNGASLNQLLDIESHQGGKENAEKKGHASSQAALEETKDKVDLLPSHDVRKELRRMLILNKCRILQLLSHFMVSSSSIHQRMRQNANEKEKKSITKRIISSVLVDLEEICVPFLSSYLPSDQQHNANECLELCYSCLQFLLILSRSNEGIRVLRLQMRLESEKGQASRWSQSSIGHVALVLDATLSFANRIEESERPMRKSTHLAHAINVILDQCIDFFKNMLLFVDQQRKSTARPVTFSALISEHSTSFQSSCQRIVSHQPPSRATDPPRLLHFSEGLKGAVQEILAEIAEDQREDA